MNTKQLWQNAVRPPVILVVIAIIYLIGIIPTSFWSENEAYYTLGASSVLDGHVVMPVIYGDMVADKPPFTFWWVAGIGALLGGLNEITARIANLIPALIIAGFLIAFARRFTGHNVNALAAIVLATCYEFWENAMEVNTDMLLGASLIAALFAIYAIFHEGFSWKKWALLWIALAFGVLIKGPVAPALTCMIAVVYAGMTFGMKEGWKRLLSLRPFIGAIVCFAPFALWCAAVYNSKGIEPLKTILVQHNVGRFVEAFDHNEPWYFFFVQLPVNCLPWTLFVPVLIYLAVKKKTPKEPLEAWRRFALTAAIVVFVFFSFSQSKRDYYILPVLPWVCLLFVDAFRRVLSTESAQAESETSKRSFLRLAPAVAYGCLAVVGLYFAIGYPLLEKRRTIKPLVDVVDEEVEGNDQLVIFAEEDPRIMYYLTEKFHFVDNNPVGNEELKKILSADSDFTSSNLKLLVPQDSLRKVNKFSSIPLYVDATTVWRKDKFFLLASNMEPGSIPVDNEYVQVNGK